MQNRTVVIANEPGERRREGEKRPGRKNLDLDVR